MRFHLQDDVFKRNASLHHPHKQQQKKIQTQQNRNKNTRFNTIHFPIESLIN